MDLARKVSDIGKTLSAEDEHKNTYISMVQCWTDWCPGHAKPKYTRMEPQNTKNKVSSKLPKSEGRKEGELDVIISARGMKMVLAIANIIKCPSRVRQ